MSCNYGLHLVVLQKPGGRQLCLLAWVCVLSDQCYQSYVELCEYMRLSY